MDDLISRQAAIDIYCSYCVWNCKKNGEMPFGCRAVNDLNRLPSAQPEIVRCKDCKHYEEINQPYPQMFCRRHQLDTLEDDYCSYGERGDDEDTV